MYLIIIGKVGGSGISKLKKMVYLIRFKLKENNIKDIKILGGIVKLKISHLKHKLVFLEPAQLSHPQINDRGASICIDTDLGESYLSSLPVDKGIRYTIKNLWQNNTKKGYEKNNNYFPPNDENILSITINDKELIKEKFDETLERDYNELELNE